MAVMNQVFCYPYRTTVKFIMKLCKEFELDLAASPHSTDVLYLHCKGEALYHLES